MFEIKKPTPYRRESYLKFVRSHACSHCGSPPPNHAHHLIGIGLKSGISTKISDGLTIPLCGDCHAKVHRNTEDVDQTYYFMRFMRDAFDNNKITLITKK
jgi:hypothetical protein